MTGLYGEFTVVLLSFMKTYKAKGYLMMHLSFPRTEARARLLDAWL
jgi:hypothetical protein